MSTILMSIKPVYVEKIFSGEKKYEYRKTKCREDVDRIIVYATNPVKKVVGELIIEKVLYDKKENIWNKTKEDSGVVKEKFDKYFYNSDYAVAYKIKKVIKYGQEYDLKYYNIKKAPQSFIYLK